MKKMPMETLSDLTGWLITGGAVVGVSWALSWALEGWSTWEKLSKHSKSLLILLASLGVAMVAVWLRSLPEEALAPYQPYAATLIVTVVAWLSTQVAHRNGK
jgi:hypothetical protein